MFGKAVQIRHCLATVSAPAAFLVVLERSSAGIRPDATGKVSWEGGSERRKSGDRSLGATYLLTFRGGRRISMSFCFGLCGPRELRCVAPLCAVFFLLSATLLHAGVIRGTVTDTSGATVTGATVVLMNGNKYVSKT